MNNTNIDFEEYECTEEGASNLFYGDLIVDAPFYCAPDYHYTHLCVEGKQIAKRENIILAHYEYSLPTRLYSVVGFLSSHLFQPYQLINAMYDYKGHLLVSVREEFTDIQVIKDYLLPSLCSAWEWLNECPETVCVRLNGKWYDSDGNFERLAAMNQPFFSRIRHSELPSEANAIKGAWT